MKCPRCKCQVEVYGQGYFCECPEGEDEWVLRRYEE